MVSLVPFMRLINDCYGFNMVEVGNEMNWKRIGCLGILVIILAIIIGSVVFWWTGKPKEEPGIDEARYIVNTLSRVYYTDKYEKTPEGYILHGYWEMQKGSWKYIDKRLTLNEDAFGRIEIRGRE